MGGTTIKVAREGVQRDRDDASDRARAFDNTYRASVTGTAKRTWAFSTPPIPRATADTYEATLGIVTAQPCSGDILDLAHTGVTGVAATDVFTKTAHGWANGKTVVFASLTGGTGLALGTVYYIIGATANTFQLSLTVGGAAVNFTTDVTDASIGGSISCCSEITGNTPLAIGTAQYSVISFALHEI